MKLVWFPEWMCQNYTMGKSYGAKCPYCPYSFDRHSKRLIYNDRQTASGEPALLDDLLAFFHANGDTIGRYVEISGGEPLLYGHLPEVLGPGLGPGWTWGITSNTLNTRIIEESIAACGGYLGGCVCWTASYHPLSNRDDVFASNIELVRRHVPGMVKVTVVIAESTIDRLDASLAFLSRLPLGAVHYHLDTHGTNDREALLAKARAIIGPAAVFAGYSPVGKLCNKHGALVAVGADGTLYECVTKAYENLDPICKVNGDVRLADLPELIENCEIACFACCDHIKHMS